MADANRLGLFMAYRYTEKVCVTRPIRFPVPTLRFYRLRKLAIRWQPAFGFYSSPSYICKNLSY